MNCVTSLHSLPTVTASTNALEWLEKKAWKIPNATTQLSLGPSFGPFGQIKELIFLWDCWAQLRGPGILWRRPIAFLIYQEAPGETHVWLIIESATWQNSFNLLEECFKSRWLEFREEENVWIGIFVFWFEVFGGFFSLFLFFGNSFRNNSHLQYLDLFEALLPPAIKER